MENIIRGNSENSKVRRFKDLDKSSLPTDGGSEFNRLIFATSPYLLQHADNPVNWYQWGEEAFAKAALADKPVMLSIGYATCHWCHVMARESFEDPEVAEVINRCVVPVKVDREERPDIDSIYMTAAGILTGGNMGWPLTIFLTPDRKPFYAATYIPKYGRNGVLGIIETLEKLTEAWQFKREQIEENCSAIIKAFSEKANITSAETDFGDILDASLASLQGIYDFMNGGFGNKNKFPLPHYITFLIRMWQRTKNDDIEEIVEATLRAMRDGGIFDQLGFGFHRYTVDNQWLIPHFEKMLYDQALVAMAYMEAFQAFGDDYLKKTATETLSFVVREMSSPEGGFFSGLDADSEGVEGKYYLWTPKEINKLLDEESSRLFCQAFGVSENGNFEGSNVLHIPVSPDMIAKENGMNPKDLLNILDNSRSKLLTARKTRTMPFRDEKIITAWNGLMIASLARGTAVNGDTVFLDAAEKAARFVESNLRNRNGRLLRSYHLGETSVPAFLEDHAFLCWGMIELYQTSGKNEFLDRALQLAGDILQLFLDETDGCFFDTGADTGDVLVRMKSNYDGAIPSGNSMACFCLLKLGKITFDDKLTHAGEKCLRSCMGNLKQQPVAHIQMVNALDFYLGPDVEITLVGDRDNADTKEMLSAINTKYLPGLILRFKEDGELDSFRTIDGRTTAYICAKRACRPPVNDLAGLEQLLGEIG